MITPAIAWKKKTEFVQLPSGHVAELQKPSALSLVLRSGNIPDSLSETLSSQISGKTKTWQPRANEMAGMVELIDTIAKAAFVAPVVVASDPDYEAGEIALSDIDDTDKFFILGWALGDGAQAAERFPAQPNASLPPAPDGESLRDASE